ncbi:oxidoreductase [Halobacteriales archaeon QS_1_68_17]|nr:MAG: oxidoreductase [Halobacteriales archaeon QS_1_68_17]
MEDVAVSIEAVRSVGDGGIAVELSSPSGFAAAPGQFVNLSAEVAGEEVSRVYTISSPDVDRTFETTVEVDPEGAFSPWLAEASPGTTVRMSGPYGNAYYEGEPRVVIVAGGPGVGPAVAIAERALADGGEAAVVYRDEVPLHRARLDSLATAGATVHVLDAEEDLAPAVADAVSGTEDEQVFVYGFDGFVGQARAAIDAAGGDRTAAKVENFG